MNWFTAALGSSVGKKVLMALTGIAFVGFLAAHLAGNLTLIAGKEAFNGYAERLRSLGPILHLFRAGLIAFALVHIITGLTLFLQNRKARPVAYRMDTSAGGRTISSRTMPYTGLIILAFLVFHLFHFTWTDKGTLTIFDLVAASFQHPGFILLYIAAMIVAALHVRHGFWSAFQSIGANHPKTMPAVMALSWAAGAVVAFGFGLLPLFIMVRY
jgi:succinate dehydrogenase / fumarate reductase, cytochrome b subunit